MNDGKKDVRIGENLKRFRRDFGYTQQEVSEKIGIMQQAYYRYEADRTVPTVEVIINIAKEFDVSADYLLGLIDTPRPLKITDSDNELIQAATNCRSAIKALNDAFEKRDKQIMEQSINSTG